MRIRKRAAMPGGTQRVKQSPVILYVHLGSGAAKARVVPVYARKQRPHSELECKRCNTLMIIYKNYLVLSKLDRPIAKGSVMSISDWWARISAGYPG